MDIARAVAKLTRRLQNRIRLMVGRCVIRAVNDGSGLQLLQVEGLSGEILDKVERLQEYGFTSRPKPGSQAVMVSVAGVRAHSLVIACEDRRYRLTGLEAGEVGLYDDLGQVVRLKRDGILMHTAKTVTVEAGESIVLDTPLVRATGEIKAANDITDMTSGAGVSMAEMRSIYNGHNHPENDEGGPTDAPNQEM